MKGFTAVLLAFIFYCFQKNLLKLSHCQIFRVVSWLTTYSNHFYITLTLYLNVYIVLFYYYIDVVYTITTVNINHKYKKKYNPQ